MHPTIGHETGVMPWPVREPRCKHGSHQSGRATMPAASYDLSISAARADALVASVLQSSDEPSARQARQAIAAAIGAYSDLRHQRLGLVGAATTSRAVRRA
jgi:hypothetical protein